jgi:chromosome partitioning protein
MLRIVASYNVKGGVGKTTTAVNIACLAARSGLRTVLWDLDPQGGAGFCLDIDSRSPSRSRKLIAGKRDLLDVLQPTTFPGLHLLPADRSYRNMDLHLESAKHPERRLLKLMRPLAREFDLLMLDCAPSISLVSENVFRAADALLMPVVPNPLSVRSVNQVREFLVRERLTDIALVPFFSMVDRRKQLHREMLDAHPPGFANTAIPYSSEVERMTVRRAPLVSYAPLSRAGQAYEELWSELAAAQGLVRPDQGR